MASTRGLAIDSLLLVPEDIIRLPDPGSSFAESNSSARNVVIMWSGGDGLVVLASCRVLTTCSVWLSQLELELQLELQRPSLVLVILGVVAE